MDRFKTVRSKLAAGFAIGPIVLIIVGWITYTNTQELALSRAEQEHTYAMLLQIDQILSDLVNAETGQRGYILTGLDRYLEPYNSAKADITNAVGRLATLTADNPHQIGRIEALRPLVQQKLTELEETIALRRDKSFDAAVAVVTTDRGKTIM